MLNKIHVRPHPYTVSIIVVGAVTLLTQQLELILAESQTLLFFAAVVMSSWYGGLKSGGLSAILSTVAIKFFFIPPIYALSVADLNDGIRLAIFVLMALIGSLPGMQLEQVKQQVKQQTQALNDRKIEESDKQLRMALQAARMGIWQLDLITGKTVWTVETEQLFGFAPGSFDGKYETFIASVHPDDLEALNQATQAAIQSGSDYRHDYRIIYADGSIHWIESSAQVFYDNQGQPVRMIGSAIDITDRKQTEEILRQYERVVSATPDKVSLVDRSYTYRLVNQTYLSASQKQREEVVGHTVSELLGETVFQTIVKPQFDRCLAGETIRYESWFDYPDGLPHFLSVTYVPYVELDGTISGVVVTVRDLNDLKQAETDLEESRAFLNQIINVMSDPIFVKDEQHRFVLVNQACCDMMGIAQDAFLGQSDYDFFSQAQADHFRAKDNYVFQTGLEDVTEEPLTNPDGETYWLLTKKLCFQNQHGQKFLVGASRDITERKRAEQILQASEERFRLLIQNVDVGIILAGSQAEILTCNQVALKLLGLTEAELLRRTALDAIWNAVHEDGSGFDPATLPIALAIETRQPVKNVVIGIHQVNSSNLIWLLVSAIPQFDAAGNVCFVICSFSDITARKQAEAIRQQQALQEQGFSQIVQAIRNSLDLNTIFATATREFAELLQLDLVGIPQYFPERSSWIPIAEHIRQPESLSLLGVEIADTNNPITQRLQRREIVLVENTHTLNDPVNQAIAQQHTPVAWLMVPLEVNGIIWGCLVGVKSPLPATFTNNEIHLAQRFADQLSIAIQQANLYQQVQELNQELEQRVQHRTAALQESEEKFRQLAENINHVFWMEDTTGDVLYTSPSYEEIWGQPIESLCHNPHAWLDVVHPDDRDHVIAQQYFLQKCLVKEIEYRIIRSDGVIRWILDRSFPIRNAQGDVYRIAGLAEDITDRKQAELERQRQAEADQLLAVIAQTINQSVHLNQVLDPCLEQVRQFLQCDRVIVARFEADYRLVIEMEAVSRSELSLQGYAFHNPGFSSDWVKSIRQEGVIAHNDIQNDVQNDIRSEALPLWQSEFLTQIQVRASVLVPILQADQLWGVLIVNQCDQPRQWQPSEIDLLKQLGLQVGTAGQKASLYTQLESQLAQKEVLLKEVHHRVKNNLQVISSMLWLQTKATDQSTLSNALSDTRSRLQAMALIHETLYRSSNLGQLNFHDYVRCLANGILAAHSSSAKQISLCYRLQPVTFNLDTAIPCGLLLNELITNAIKHAFPDQKSGEIRITLEQLSQEQSSQERSSQEQSSTPVSPASAPSFCSLNETGTAKQRSPAMPCYVLTIQDNGVGIPADLDLKKLKSLGLKIAYDLTLQLRGSLELNRTGGTQFRLIFSALPYRNRV